MRSNLFFIINTLLLTLLNSQSYAGSFAVVAEGGNYDQDALNATGPPDGIYCDTACGPGGGPLYVYWNYSSIPTNSDWIRFRVYLGTRWYNNDWTYAPLYEDGVGYQNYYSGQTYAYEVITTESVPSSVEGHSLIGLRIYTQCVPPLQSLNRITVDAVEIIDSDYDGGECEIVSLVFDEDVYQSGTDVANIKVAILNNRTDSADMTVSLFFYDRGLLADNAVEQFSLYPNTYNISNFMYIVPILPYSTEYSAKATLLAQYPFGVRCLDEMHVNPAFGVTALSQEEIQQYQDELEQCFIDSDWNCVLAVIKLIPYASIGAQAISFVDHMCVAGQLHRAGFEEQSWAAFSAGVLSFVKTGLAIYAHNLGEFKNIVHELQTILSANDCVNSEFVQNLLEMFPIGLSLSNSMMAKDTLVDSLAAWINAGFDSTEVEYADVLVIEGQCDVMVEADSAWAVEDSTGLIAASFAYIDTVGSATFVSKNIHALKDSAACNPHSFSIFQLHNFVEPAIDIGLLHHNESDSLLFFRYPYVSVIPQSKLRIEVADTLDLIVVLCDYNGDGEVDYYVYPAGTTDSNDPQMPIPSGLKITNIPNPFNPSTLILYELPHSGNVRIDIYDVVGKRVKTLVDETQEAGEREVTWNGRDTNGSVVSSGVYFIRLALAGDSVTRKIVLLK